MRTFHIGGAASGISVENKVEAGIDGKVVYDCRVIKRKDRTFIVVSQSSEINVEDENGRVVERHRIPYGTTLNFPSGSKIKQGDLLAKWDPLTLSLIHISEPTRPY